MELISLGITDIGRVRKTNEDSFICDDHLRLWAVADGMGGHDAGEIASDLAVTLMHSKTRLEKPQIEADFRTIIADVNQQIYNYGIEHNLPNGLGTTLTGLADVGNNKFFAYHVGDSRLYRLREQTLELLTTDHSWVQHQIDLGELTEEQAQKHPLKNVIMRSLGYDVDVFPDILEVEVRSGDIYLLASDGLTNKISREEIHHQLCTDFDPAIALRNMLDIALGNGGEDNITAVILRAH